MSGSRLLDYHIKLAFILVVFMKGHFGSPQCSYDSVDQFLEQYNKEADALQKEDTLASWNYETDMNDENKKKTTELSVKTSKFSTQARENASCLIKKFGKNTEASKLRQLKLITRTSSSDNSEVSKKISSLVSQMTAIYSETKVSIFYNNFQEPFSYC